MSEHDAISAPLDNLSPTGRKLLRFNLETAYTRLTVSGPGNDDARAILEGLKPSDLLHADIRDHNEAAGVLSGLWLWHDWLDESHTISQSIETPSGSFWHGIMHRREGDFSNAKYWFRRVGEHPIFPAIANNANLILNALPADKAFVKLTLNGWDPYAFVDLVEQYHDRPDTPQHKALVSLQQLEWRQLFDHCVRNAG